MMERVCQSRFWENKTVHRATPVKTDTNVSLRDTAGDRNIKTRSRNHCCRRNEIIIQHL
jgi:hypothetical protein